MKTAALFLSMMLFTASAALAADPPAGGAGTAGTAAKDEAAAVESSAAESSAPAAESAPSAVAPAAEGAPSAVAPAAASPTEGKAMADVKRIRERAARVEPKEKEATEKSLRDTAAEVDAVAAKKEKMEVAGRLAAEFGGIPELYLGEHERLKSGWGELAIAHTILANAATTLTIDQLYDLKQEGIGWGQIAQGLDLNLGEFVKMANAKSRSTVGAPSHLPKSDLTEAKAEMNAKEKSAAPAAKGSGEAKSAAASPAAAKAKAKK